MAILAHAIQEALYACELDARSQFPCCAFVPCPHEVSRRATLCPLFFFHFILIIDLIEEGVEGAITGSSTVRVTHTLYADDLCLTANRPDQLQTMLDRLDGYARRKGLTINTAKSEVVHFISHGCNVPAFSVGGAPLASKDSFKYLGHGFL